MSDDLIKQVKDLTDKNAQLNVQIKNMTAQITATNQLYSDTIQASIALKTNGILFQQMVQDLNQQLSQKSLECSKLNAELIKLKQPEAPKEAEAAAA